MQLYILDKNPIISANLIPDKYKFKMLIELGQLICSVGLSNVYKPIKQGKELQTWVSDNKWWIYDYYNEGGFLGMISQWFVYWIMGVFAFLLVENINYYKNYKLILKNREN